MLANGVDSQEQMRQTDNARFRAEMAKMLHEDDMEEISNDAG